MQIIGEASESQENMKEIIKRSQLISSVIILKEEYHSSRDEIDR